MTAAVLVRDVVEAIDTLEEGRTAHLNRHNGEVYTLQDEDADLLESGAADPPEWQQDELPKIREVLESGNWLPLPASFEVHEWSIMEGFSRSVPEAAVRRALKDAIRGPDAFRHFREAIARCGVQDAWGAYRAAALERIAIDWLDEQGIPYRTDSGSPETRGAPPSR